MNESVVASRFLRLAAERLNNITIEYTGSPERKSYGYGPLHQAAAVLSNFDLRELVKSQPKTASEEIHALTSDSRSIKQAKGGGAGCWTCMLDSEFWGSSGTWGGSGNSSKR